MSLAKSMYQIINRTLNVPPQMPESEAMKVAKECALAEMGNQYILVDMLAEGKHVMNGMEFDRYTVIVYLPTS